jgi:hypothetical protein
VPEGLWLRKTARCGPPAVRRPRSGRLARSRPPPAGSMSVAHSTSVATILREQVSLEVASIDRLDLHVYVPLRQRAPGVVTFFRHHRGAAGASAALLEPISAAFVAALERYARTPGGPRRTFAKGRRKDDGAAAHRADCGARVWRPEKRHTPQTGPPSPWIVPSTALVNHDDIYALDADVGPFFRTVCRNGPASLTRQVTKAGGACETAYGRAPTRRAPRRAPTASAPPGSTACGARGWRGCRTPSRRPTAPPARATTCPSCTPRARSRRCVTLPSRGASSAPRGSARSWTWAGPTMSTASSRGA